MKQIVRGAAVAVVVALAATAAGGVAGASVGAKAKKVPESKYAKVMCRTYNQVLKDTNGFASDLSSNTQSDPAAFQSQVGTLADALLAKLVAAERTLKGIYPDVDGGKKIAKQFATNTVELQTIIGDAVAKFRAADPTSPAFSADVTVLGVSLSTLGTQLTDVTRGIDNQDFIGAVGNEKGCHKIFPVTGG